MQHLVLAEPPAKKVTMLAAPPAPRHPLPHHSKTAASIGNEVDWEGQAA
jgi:hypothetical protein